MRTLYHSLGIEMPSKTSSSFFAEVSWKVKKKSKREKHSVTYYTIKDITDFILFFFLLKFHQKSRNKSIWEEYVVSQSWHQNATNDFLFQCFLLKLHEKSKDRTQTCTSQICRFFLPSFRGRMAYAFSLEKSRSLYQVIGPMWQKFIYISISQNSKTD